MEKQVLNRTTTNGDQRSLGELFSELAGESTTLIKQEVALAQAEITRKLTRTGTNIGYLAVGGSVAFVAFQAIVAAVIIALGSILENYWLSALIVGAVIGVVAYFLVSSAIEALRNIEPVPEKTKETVKEDIKWVKNQVS